MSAFGVRVLSVPALLAVCLCSFPVLLLAELTSLPDPTGSRLCAPPCCARSAPIPGELCSTSFPLPVVRFRPALLRFSLYAPVLIRSAVMVFHSSPPVGWRTTEPPPRRLASRPSVPVCGLCSVAVLLCPWLYHGNIKADNRITAIGS